MNDYQTLFSIIFGIYFATSVATSGRFAPFDTSAALAGDWRALLRLLLALLLLNILPFSYFLWVLGCLDTESGSITSDLRHSFAILLASLGGFGFYRLFIGAVMLRRCKQRKLYFFYTDPADRISERLKRAAECRRPPEDAVVYGPWLNGMGGVLWLSICLLGFSLLR